MASNSILASMAVALTANVSDFQRGMAAAKKELAGFKKAGEEMKSFGENLSKYISAPLAGLAAVSLKTFGDIQALQKGLYAVAGTAEAADKQFKSLKEVAKLPGLGLEEAIQGSINLQAAGFSAELAEGALKGFGNALATVGKGKAELDGVTTALSQMAAKGKISAEEINQIAERVPQIRKVMEKAFGTSNTEELQKMGISATEFVSKVNDELAKLPPVAGGLKNSFENLADSGKLAFANLGEAISKTLNVEGFINAIADKITALADAFSELSPGMQRFIVIGAAVAAAAGPLLFAFGAISAAIPTLVAGFSVLTGAFAALTGPIGLAAAGIGAAVALIIRNWDTIKTYFTTGAGAGIFNKLKETALAAFNRISDTISAFVDFAQAIWERWGATIISAAKLFLSPLVSVFKTAFSALGAVLDLWRAAFEGNWSKVWVSAKNIAAIAVNSIIDLVAGMATAIPRLLGGALKGLGIDNAITRGLEASVSGIRALAEMFKIQTQEVYKSTAAIATNAAAMDAVDISTNKATASFDRQATALKGLRQRYKEHWMEMRVVAEQTQKQLREGLMLKVEMAPIDMSQLQGTLTESEEAFADWATNIRAMFTNLATDAVIGLGNAIATAVNGGGVKEALNGFLLIIADWAGQFGKYLIGAGIAALKLGELIAAGPIGAAGAIAAGVALVAMAGMAKNALSKGPSGFSGPKSGSPNYSNPGMDYGYGSKQVEFMIKGTDLVGVMDRTGYRNRRFGG